MQHLRHGIFIALLVIAGVSWVIAVWGMSIVGAEFRKVKREGGLPYIPMRNVTVIFSNFLPRVETARRILVGALVTFIATVLVLAIFFGQPLKT